MTGIIIAAVVVSLTGLILGLFLGVMGKKFAVEVDQKEIDVRAELPGNNCGGCGYAGCDALAKAIAASNGHALTQEPYPIQPYVHAFEPPFGANGITVHSSTPEYL